MNEVKGFDYFYNPYNYGFGINIYFEPELPTLIQISFLCFTFEINRYLYWKN